ncbi:MAG: hypothetical protein IH968_19510 [Gemmatimonadetes bacterium]|nr:hypothetical protein [Gemmatimonadota bacterium]
MTKAKRLTISQTDLARVFGVSTRTIQRWEEEGLREARIGRRATYALPVAVAWRVDRERRESDVMDFNEARARKMAAQAELTEIEVARARAEYIHVSDLDHLLAEPLARLRGRLLSFAGVVAPRLTEPLEVPQAVAIIDGAMAEFLEPISREGLLGGDQD